MHYVYYQYKGRNSCIVATKAVEHCFVGCFHCVCTPFSYQTSGSFSFQLLYILLSTGFLDLKYELACCWHPISFITDIWRFAIFASHSHLFVFIGRFNCSVRDILYNVYPYGRRDRVQYSITQAWCDPDGGYRPPAIWDSTCLCYILWFSTIL